MAAISKSPSLSKSRATARMVVRKLVQELMRKLEQPTRRAVTGALIMAFDVTLKAPHGGIFVFFAIGKLAWFVVALAAGTVVGAVAVIAAKQFTGVRPAAETPERAVAA